MSLTLKARWMLDRAVACIRSEGGRIWGFIGTAEDEGAEIEPFSSHNDPIEKFVEMTASASALMLDGEGKPDATAN